jgi:hypothetical protein
VTTIIGIAVIGAVCWLTLYAAAVAVVRLAQERAEAKEKELVRQLLRKGNGDD